VGAERRRTLRKTFTQPAGLFHPHGKRICACVTRDISATGARLKVDHSQSAAIDEIPGEFILTISESGNVFRRCRLVWRRNDELGVYFAGPDVVPVT
jgi:hypothetical protein